MRPDPIIEEIHQIRLAIEDECQGNFGLLSKRATQIEQQYQERLVNKPFSNEFRTGSLAPSHSTPTNLPSH